MPAAQTLLFTCQIPVRWGDMDSFGHVNNIIYLQYLEEARLQWLNHCKIALGADDAKPVLLQIQNTYLKPVTYPTNLIVHLYAGAVGRSSLVLEHRMYQADSPEQCCAEGYCKLVWITADTGQATPLPATLRALLPWASDSYTCSRPTHRP